VGWGGGERVRRRGGGGERACVRCGSGRKAERVVRKGCRFRRVMKMNAEKERDGERESFEHSSALGAFVRPETGGRERERGRKRKR
jgi:hypothetical protein